MCLDCLESVKCTTRAINANEGTRISPSSERSALSHTHRKLGALTLTNRRVGISITRNVSKRKILASCIYERDALRDRWKSPNYLNPYFYGQDVYLNHSGVSASVPCRLAEKYFHSFLLPFPVPAQFWSYRIFSNVLLQRC